MIDNDAINAQDDVYRIKKIHHRSQGHQIEAQVHRISAYSVKAIGFEFSFPCWDAQSGGPAQIDQTDHRKKKAQKTQYIGGITYNC